MGEQQKQVHNQLSRTRHGWWVGLGGAVLLALALLSQANVWAGPMADRMNQTIPQRTPTSEPTQVPTVTPTTPPGATNTPQSNPTATPGGDAGSNPTPVPGDTPTPAPEDASAPAPTDPDVRLLLQIEGSPALVMQGDELVLRFILSNTGSASAVNVQVRDQLPNGLSLIESTVGDGSVSTETSATGSTVVLLAWPSLAPGAQAVAEVRLRVADDVLDGTIIGNLAVLWADNGAPFTAGISVGMPPALLPTFD